MSNSCNGSVGVMQVSQNAAVNSLLQSAAVAVTITQDRLCL
jgi:hypothetical protein